MRAAFYGLLRDDAIRTGGAAALLLRYTRYRGTRRGRDGRGRRGGEKQALAARPGSGNAPSQADPRQRLNRMRTYRSIMTTFGEECTCGGGGRGRDRKWPP